MFVVNELLSYTTIVMIVLLTNGQESETGDSSVVLLSDGKNVGNNSSSDQQQDNGGEAGSNLGFLVIFMGGGIFVTIIYLICAYIYLSQEMAQLQTQTNLFKTKTMNIKSEILLGAQQTFYNVLVVKYIGTCTENGRTRNTKYKLQFHPNGYVWGLCFDDQDGVTYVSGFHKVYYINNAGNFLCKWVECPLMLYIDYKTGNFSDGYVNSALQNECLFTICTFRGKFNNQWELLPRSFQGSYETSTGRCGEKDVARY
eukprot:TRINITY_DN14671_c0_g1_i4.p1 TRINITY_DN14671_c0_g1~~TRINITY_DN14671_c0_g1_i4.p1  ORF type:complete len:256 (-),score=20.55 TRINITY_DN14671_c0_g1_i4:728-1495(-)